MQARALTIWLLRLAIAASLLFPILLFTFAAWSSYRHVQALADERVVRSLDVQQEQALKTFQLIDLTLNNANDLVSGMSDADIRNHEEELHSQLKKLAGAAPVVQSIWIYDKEGRTLVSSWVHPPPEQIFSDRDFFMAHVKADIGTYYGQVYNSQFDAEPFFTVSRRLARDGEFLGVLEVSVLPSTFCAFSRRWHTRMACNTR